MLLLGNGQRDKGHFPMGCPLSLLLSGVNGLVGTGTSPLGGCPCPLENGRLNQ